MQYSIVLSNPKTGNAEYYDDVLLPGFYPEHVFDLMVAGMVHKEMGICEHRDMACHCHVLHWIDEHKARKLCTVLFHDLIKPRWKLKDVI